VTRDNGDEIRHDNIPELDLDAVGTFTAEQRLWLAVLYFAIQESFTTDRELRHGARDWLLSQDTGEFSAAWICEILSVTGLPRLQARIRQARYYRGRRDSILRFTPGEDGLNEDR
jgi:hypothetical protein